MNDRTSISVMLKFFKTAFELRFIDFFTQSILEFDDLFQDLRRGKGVDGDCPEHNDILIYILLWLSKIMQLKLTWIK